MAALREVEGRDASVGQSRAFSRRFDFVVDGIVGEGLNGTRCRVSWDRLVEEPCGLRLVRRCFTLQDKVCLMTIDYDDQSSIW